MTRSGQLTLAIAVGAIVCFFAAVGLWMLQADAEQPHSPPPTMLDGLVGYCTPYGHRIYENTRTGEMAAVEDPYCAAKLDDQ